MATYDFSNAIPYVPTHVGELINDELVASGLSVEQLSEKANIELIALNPNRSLEKASCHFLMTAIRKTALYMLDS